MFFDDCRAVRHGGNRHADPRCVIRQPDFATEHLFHMRDRSKVGVGGRRGITARAFEQGQIGATVVARGSNKIVDLRHGCHARRGDDRLAELCDLFDQRQVDALERRDLIDGAIDRLEEIDGGRIERRDLDCTARTIFPATPTAYKPLGRVRRANDLPRGFSGWR